MIKFDMNDLYECLQNYQKWPLDFNLKFEDYDESDESNKIAGLVKADTCAKLKSYDFYIDFYIEISFNSDGVSLGSFSFGYLKDKKNRKKVLELLNQFNNDSFLSKAVISDYDLLSLNVNMGFNNISCVPFCLDEFFEELNNIADDETLNELITYFGGYTGCYAYL